MRSRVLFCQDGMYYYVSFVDDVPMWLEDDIERVEGEIGAEYEKRVGDGECVEVGTIYYHRDQTWNLELLEPREVGPADHPTYEHEFGGFS